MFFEYSLWFLPIIIILALIGTVLHSGLIGKRFSFLNKYDNVTKRQRYILSSLRFLSLFLILLLFLSPVKIINHKRIEKPTVIIAQDCSSSLTNIDFEKYNAELERFCKDLKKDYNIVQLQFGSKVKPFDFNNNKVLPKDFATDFSLLYSYISENYSEENLSAIVLASDGINTQGHSILNVEEYFSCPVYTVAMGDTTISKDIKINDIRYNKICFLDDEFPLEINIKADKCLGEKVSLSMTYEGKTSVVKDFVVSDNDYFISIPYKSIAKKVGINRISFNVTTLDKEKNIVNNHKDIFIEVLNTKKKILILAAGINADVAAIKNIAEENKNYECKVFVAADIYKANLKEEYDVAILYNLPDNNNSFNLIKQLQKQETPLVFVVGQQTNISYFNALQNSLQITPISPNPLQTLATYNSNFSPFTLGEETLNMLRKFPPLLSPTAKYKTSPNLEVLLYQKIGNIATDYPLVAFANDGINKIGYILGENIWRWKLHNYMFNSSFNEVNELLSKTLQLVSDKENKKRFRLECKEMYDRSEDVIVQAQLYNDNYELVNTSEVKFNLKHTPYGKAQASADKVFTFGKTANAYYLNLSTLQEGEYTIEARTKLGDKVLTDKASFVVKENNIEQNDLVARHSDLFTLSQKTNGKMVYPDELDKLKQYLKENQNIKPMIYENLENRRFISLWWYWLLIALSLSAEWFLRKYWRE